MMDGEALKIDHLSLKIASLVFTRHAFMNGYGIGKAFRSNASFYFCFLYRMYLLHA